MSKLIVKKLFIYGLAFALLIACLPLTAPTSVYAADEYDSLRIKWKEMMTGGTSYNPSDPDIAAQIASINATAQANWSSMNKSSSRTYLWSDLTFSQSSHITATYTRLETLALAFVTKGAALEGNTSMLADLTSALDWMYTNKYNEGTTAVGNWWDWEIGTPLNLNDTVVLIYDELSSTQITNYMKASAKFQPTVTMTGANRLWECAIIAVRGIITKNSGLIAAARNGVSPAFDYASTGDGFYKDGSFIQHEKFSYNGGYGASMLSDVTRVMYLLEGSSWEITDPDKSNLYDFVYDAFEPLVYKGEMMSMTGGRTISRYYTSSHGLGNGIARVILQISQFAPPADALRMKRMAKEWIQQDTYHNFFEASIPTIVLGKALLNDSSIVPRGELITHRQFRNMDKTVHLRPGFGFAISAHSSRIANYESINGENLKGWYTGEGMTYLYNNDLGQYSDAFWPTVNSYRMPGTTVQMNTAVGSGAKSTKDWVGGTVLDGTYGAMGMELLRHGSLSMKKSWFMFDDEIVAVGSDISGTNGKVIETIVENRKLNSSGNNVLTVNGTAKPTTLGWSQTMTNVQSAHLSGSVAGSDIGYYFPSPVTVNGLREARTGTWKQIDSRSGTPENPITRNYMTMWFNHGADPTNAKYSYVLLPNKTAGQVNSYSNNPQISILENTSEAHAVRENTLNITAVNFWNNAAKTAAGITSNKKASVMVQETETEIAVSVSDPTHNNTGSISIELNHAANGTLAADAGITVTQLSPTIKFSVSVAGSRGKPIQAKFIKKPTLLYETENLTVTASSGDPHTVLNETSMSGGQGTKLDANGVGDYVTYNVSLPEPGNYRVLIGTKKINARGKAQLTIQGHDEGAPYDYYSAEGEYTEVYAGDKQFDTTGSKQFKFTVTGKHANSSSYSLVFDYIKLVRLDGVVYREAEDLSATTSAGDSHAPFDDSSMRGGKGDKLEANGTGDYVNYSVNVPKAGTYHVFAAVKKHKTRGIFQLYINDVAQGSPKNHYAWEESYTEFYLGESTFSGPGTKSFKFVVTGKHADSLGYTLGLDYLKLVAV